jgi:hypothetical protein
VPGRCDVFYAHEGLIKGESKMRILYLLTLAAAAAALSGVADAQSVDRGGQNYIFYQNGSSGGNSYTILNDYFVGTTSQTIDSQLQTMYSNGQRTLAIGIFFQDNDLPGHGEWPNSSNATCLSSGSPGGGGTVDSSSGSIPSNCLSALNDIIYAAYYYGFQRVRIRFFPAFTNNPFYWDTGHWQATGGSCGPNCTLPVAENVLAAHNWSFIESVVNGVAYGVDKYDLGNEEVFQSPPAGNGLSFYTNWLWNQWYNTYWVHGNQNTTGFSVPCDGSNNDCAGNKLPTLNTIYNVNGTEVYPGVLDLHIYGSNCPGQSTTATAGQSFIQAFDYLEGGGHTSGGFVLGEACYDGGDSSNFSAENGPTATDLNNALQSTHATIWYINPWVAYEGNLANLGFQYAGWLPNF